MFDEFEFLNI